MTVSWLGTDIFLHLLKHPARNKMDSCVVPLLLLQVAFSEKLETFNV